MATQSSAPFVSLEHEQTPVKYHYNYGRMNPIGGSPKKPLLLIGPDWPFFASMVTLLSAIGGASCYVCVLNNSATSFQFIGAVAITVIMLFMYTLTAMLDPGVVKEPRIDIEESTSEELNNICCVCHVKQKRHRYHCETCNVCIDGHDHHCPWTSKCIGKNNIVPFYAFLISTSLFFVYHILVSISPYIQPQRTKTTS